MWERFKRIVATARGEAYQQGRADERDEAVAEVPAAFVKALSQGATSAQVSIRGRQVQVGVADVDHLRPAEIRQAWATVRAIVGQASADTDGAICRHRLDMPASILFLTWVGPDGREIHVSHPRHSRYRSAC